MSGKTIKDRILECLSEGPKSSLGVTEATGITKRQAIDGISMLRKKGFLRAKKRSGREFIWELTEKGRQEPCMIEPAAEEESTWYDKLSDAITDPIENARDRINELLDKIAEEKSFELKMEKYGGTGSIKVNISALK